MTKIYVFILSFLLASGVAYSQNDNAAPADAPILTFETTSHNFGTIKEDGGPAVYTFKFTNTGNKPLKIDRAQPGCGCTVTDFTKDDVPPKGQGYVKATFDPNGRVGTFNKSVMVYSNAKPSPQVLSFNGTVLARIKTIEDSFPNASGNLRMQTNSLSFNSLKNNLKDTFQVLSLYNSGTSAISVKSIKGPNFIFTKGSDLPLTLQPKQKGRLEIHYNVSEAKDYGLIFEQIKLVTDDVKMPEKDLSVIADVHQYFPPMTAEEKAKAPKIVFDKMTNDFGDVKQGEIVTTQFKFTNNGTQDLNIIKTKTSCGCTVSEPEKTLLKAGETTNIKVTFYTAGKKGKESKDIHVYTNDPSNPEPTLKIMANVIVPATGGADAKTASAKATPAVIDYTEGGKKFVGEWVATNDKKMKLAIKTDDGATYTIKGKKIDYTSTFTNGVLTVITPAAAGSTTATATSQVTYNQTADHITVDGVEYMRK